VAARAFPGRAAAGTRTGIVLSRTGRPLLADPEPLLAAVRAGLDTARLWDELDTDWLVLDAELLPWTVAGPGLVRERYEPVSRAGTADLAAGIAALRAAAARGVPVDGELARVEAAARDIASFDATWRRYAGLGEPVRLAPFCVLAGAGEVYAERGVAWQLGVLDRLVTAAPEHVVRTERLSVTLTDAASRDAGVTWWRDLVDHGAEGVVVKPAGGCVRGPKGLVQPGLKVRGPDYLSLVYGPHYRAPENLARLRERNVGRKRGLALREYALGLEALRRFVAEEPLWRVHEAVAGVLALESEPVDPRL
jgi:hypothetical protein